MTIASTTSGTTTSIAPCLWFDDDLEDAVALYTSLFPRSSIGHVARYPDTHPERPGAVLAADFVLDGLGMRAINGGPAFPFTEAISLSVSCRDQAEVDYYWDSLVDGGEESMCGWLKDRFGLSWQVVPQQMYDLLSDPDPLRAAAATEAMLGMRRLVVADLVAAADAAAPPAPHGG